MPKFVSEKNNVKIALVHADCDIYEPFKATLFSMWELLSENGIVLIGDLDNPELMGKTIATKEFLNSLEPNEYELKTVNIIDNNLKKEKCSYVKKLKNSHI